MTRREFLDAVGLALTGALAGFLTGRALVGEEVEPAEVDAHRYFNPRTDRFAFVEYLDPVEPVFHSRGFKMEMDWDGRWYRVP